MNYRKNSLGRLREAGEQASFDSSKVLLLVLEEIADEHPYYLDLINDQIYLSDSIKLMWGLSTEDRTPLTAEDFVSNLTSEEEKENGLKQVTRCISQKKHVEYIFTGIRKNTGETIRVLIKLNPLVDTNGNVVAIYGTDRLIEVLGQQ